MYYYYYPSLPGYGGMIKQCTACTHALVLHVGPIAPCISSQAVQTFADLDGDNIEIQSNESDLKF
jgi:hypothetical protein